MKKVLHRICITLLALLTHHQILFAQMNLDSILPIRGLAIAAPKPKNLEEFVKFINTELGPRKINTLVLRVDWNYQYNSHPELRDSISLSKADAKKIVKACKANNINIIPQINLLGHQSWASTTHNLLRVYPQFDETPHIKMPAKYAWPNADGLYCKSYCPLHPDVHKIVFELVDEIVDVFEADAFHAGMDEVFYLGDDKCPRCSGRDKAELFAGEVTKIRNHLAGNGKKLWIWGDRLIDGKTTGIGLWEASYNNTHRAIDMIPKDVTIADWHYERPDPTPAYFAMKGFNVVTCPWKKPNSAIQQLKDMVEFRRNSANQMKPRFQGMMHTVWSDPASFLDEFYGRKKDEKAGEITESNCFRKLFDKVESLEKMSPQAPGAEANAVLW